MEHRDDTREGTRDSIYMNICITLLYVSRHREIVKFVVAFDGSGAEYFRVLGSTIEYKEVSRLLGPLFGQYLCSNFICVDGSIN